MDEKKEVRKENKHFHKGTEKKTYRGNKRGSFAAGKRDVKERKDFRKKRLEVGSVFHDRELGDSIVKEITDTQITVEFNGTEKVFPRRKREDRPALEKSEQPVQRVYAKDDRNPVFKFDTTADRLTERKPGEKRSPIKVGLHVVDEVMGPGVVGRITERGTYVTYEKTGEFVLYPSGLPIKLLKSAFPEEYKKKPQNGRAPKGKARVYRVPEKKAILAEESSRPADSLQNRKGDKALTHYIEIGEGTTVLNKLYGEGVIVDIQGHEFMIDFSGEIKKFPYPEALADGRLSIIEK